MSMPEAGSCSYEDYEEGKHFLVPPERLCADAIYTFACRARSSQAWQACLLPARVSKAIPVESDEVPYVVLMSLGEKRSGGFGEVEHYLFDHTGLMRLPVDGEELEEAYLRHRFDARDTALQNIGQQVETVRSRVETVPFVIPRELR